MAQTIKNSDINNHQELSIQVSLSGLSFCILQRDSNTISIIKHIEFEKKLNPFDALDRIKHVFNTEDALKNNFKSVHVTHVNELSTLVPKALFNEDNLADYLKFNSKILKTDFITFDEIALNDSVNVYVPYVNINNFIYDTFGSFTYKHFSTILIENILAIDKNSESQKVYVHVESNHFEIVILDKGNLIIYNTFEYSNEEDFMYYLLFTIEQLQLNPETIKVLFLGQIKKEDPLYKIAYQYIRHIGFSDKQDSYIYKNKPDSNYSDFTLIKNLS
ncbi:MAG: DUF3822 family protein [Flavobacteriales bacterium]|nr:DUF3822 family protein [Flavobacteriia bacterium]NCP07038.1 DUF3822 family protein [Flavobacteriales bacterium]PIV92717.1 MAG: DUF3822 domain-containing protein [Flavobacteriaceae bacterium CG17_big_fil_post_rev_8_21_14_2_50_33_15]PIY10776.1 MAG: DUF3822 domain-containing protein [Flavobacteriaceae bacterium CG_4_10_14_3_um_filter_33_47]PJB18369.1 MAG: DUF3822 domain-containing protein [Flavobacteriaceae bacterium CG_4_9_14_3_um_filter_33_16]